MEGDGKPIFRGDAWVVHLPDPECNFPRRGALWLVLVVWGRFGPSDLMLQARMACGTVRRKGLQKGDYCQIPQELACRGSRPLLPFYI